MARGKAAALVVDELAIEETLDEVVDEVADEAVDEVVDEVETAESAETVEADDRETVPASTRRAKRIDSRPPTQVERTLLAEYAPIVRQIAGGFQRRLPRNVLRDDLIAAGMSGLWDAIRKHGEERAGNFDWYVRVRIRGAILDELRAQDWLPRRARAAAAAAAKKSGATNHSAPVVVRFDEVSESDQARCLVASDTANGDRTLENRFVSDALVRAVEQLPERERHIVSLHYFKGVKFKELGRMLGVSEPRISQLHSRAMGRLRTMLEQAA